MATRVVLHIGVQKSGTTYVQQMLQDRAQKLADIGALYPLPSQRRLASPRVNHHEIATYGLLGDEYPWVGEERSAKEVPWWENLRGQVQEWPGTAVISAEALSVVRRDAAERIVKALGAPDDTHVCITARGLGKLLPSVWQQHVRNGRSSSYGTYLGGLAQQRQMAWDVLEQDPQAHVWRAFALGRLAHRWASVVGPANVTLITNPGSPSNQLWHRFLEAIDLGHTSEVPAPETTVQVHGGLAAAEAQVLRSINVDLTSAAWSPDKRRRLCNQVARQFSTRNERGPKLGIPPKFREQVLRWSNDDIADLQHSGIRIVGDPEELSYSPHVEPPEPSTPDFLDAAAVAVRAAAEWKGTHKGPAPTS